MMKTIEQEIEDDEILARAAGGYPDDNPKTALGEAKPKISDTPTIGIREMGRVFTMGAAKYGRFNWREHTVSSSVYYDAAFRHLSAWFDGEDLDPESGLSHLAHVMACMNILMDAQAAGKLNDNRPAPGPGNDDACPSCGVPEGAYHAPGCYFLEDPGGAA